LIDKFKQLLIAANAPADFNAIIANNIINDPIIFPVDPRNRQLGNLTSHNSLRGYSGKITCRLTTLTPLHIKESGEPSVTVQNPNPYQAWDFYHLSSYQNANRPEMNNRVYAIPSKTLKGAVSTLYGALNNEQRVAGRNMPINNTNRLFGFVNNGGNAYMGRVNFSFAKMTEGNFAWYAVPHHYGGQLNNQRHNAHQPQMYNGYRFFEHTTLNNAAGVERLGEQHTYRPLNDKTIIRCAEPGSVFEFTVDYINLSAEELNDLLKCLGISNANPNRAIKLGKSKFLGFGSCQINVIQAKTLAGISRYRFNGERNDFLSGTSTLRNWEAIQEYDGNNLLNYNLQILNNNHD